MQIVSRNYYISLHKVIPECNNNKFTLRSNDHIGLRVNLQTNSKTKQIKAENVKQKQTEQMLHQNRLQTLRKLEIL